MRDTEPVEFMQRRTDRISPVIDVVGVAYYVIAGERQHARGGGVGVEAFIHEGAFGGRRVKAALEIAEQHVRIFQRAPHACERHRWFGDLHEVDVPGKYHRATHGTILSCGAEKAHVGGSHKRFILSGGPAK
ncbi:hypothetical protein D3C83_35840 [compost metagenome]